MGRILTPEEIKAIQHTITPIHRVHKTSQSTTFIDAERSPSKMSIKGRRESVDKLEPLNDTKKK